MTRKQHYNLYMEHNKLAKAALEQFIADHSRVDKWNEYKAESKIANKHWGIEQAMYTKEMKKKNPMWI